MPTTIANFFSDAHYEQVIAETEQFLKSVPASATAIHLKAQAHYQLGEYEDCVALLERSLVTLARQERLGTRLQLAALLANSLLELGHYEDVRALVDQSVPADSAHREEYGEMLLAGAWAAHFLGDPAQVRADISRVFEMSGEHFTCGRAAYCAALSAQAIGEPHRAKAYLVKAQTHLSVAHNLFGNPSQVRTVFQVAVQVARRGTGVALDELDSETARLPRGSKICSLLRDAVDLYRQHLAGERMEAAVIAAVSQGVKRTWVAGLPGAAARLDPQGVPAPLMAEAGLALTLGRTSSVALDSLPAVLGNDDAPLELPEVALDGEPAELADLPAGPVAEIDELPELPPAPVIDMPARVAALLPTPAPADAPTPGSFTRVRYERPTPRVLPAPKSDTRRMEAPAPAPAPAPVPAPAPAAAAAPAEEVIPVLAAEAQHGAVRPMPPVRTHEDVTPRGGVRVPSGSILLVEPIDRIALGFKLCLRDSTFKVVATAPDIDVALDRYLEHRPSVVVIDLSAHGAFDRANPTAAAFVKRFLDIDPHCRIAVVFNLQTKAAVAEAMRSGARAMVEMPMDRARVLEALVKCVSARTTLESLRVPTLQLRRPVACSWKPMDTGIRSFVGAWHNFVARALDPMGVEANLDQHLKEGTVVRLNIEMPGTDRTIQTLAEVISSREEKALHCHPTRFSYVKLPPEARDHLISFLMESLAKLRQPAARKSTAV